MLRITQSFTARSSLILSYNKSFIKNNFSTNYLKVSFIGPPNAGKSTLFNKLLDKHLNKSYKLNIEKKRNLKRYGSRLNLNFKKFQDLKSLGRSSDGAIVSAVSGTTRDRRQSFGRLGELVFEMIDTAGVDGDRLDALDSQLRSKKGIKSKKSASLSADPRRFEELNSKELKRQMMEQTLIAARESDLVFLMFDARVGVTADLVEISRWLHKAGLATEKEIVVLANKLEGDRWASSDGDSVVLDNLDEVTRVGFGEPIPISAIHGDGLADVAAVIHKAVVERTEIHDGDQVALEFGNNEGSRTSVDKEKPLQVAILGRQNVGKSTLLNSLLKFDRVIVGPTPGLTRDAISVNWSWNDRPIKIVDTAGIRKLSQRVQDNSIEDMAVNDAMRAMRVADVAVLVLDASAGFLQRQEIAIAEAVVREGRSIVVAANKMDLLEDNSESYAEGVQIQLEDRFPMLRRTPVVAMCSLNGENVDNLMPVLFNARDRWERVISTALLNRWLSDIVATHPPPLTNNRPTKIKYVIQTKGRPPTFVLFCNVDALPETYIRYLRRNFQESFEMFGMEVRFVIRRSSETNPFHDKSKNKRTGSGLGGADMRKKRNISRLKSGDSSKNSKRRSKRRQKAVGGGHRFY